MRNRYFILLLASFFAVTSHAQLVLDNNLTPEDYVQQVLLGQGVQAFNVTFNGGPGNLINVQCGGFSDGDNSNLGLNEGVILSSGWTIDAAGPNDEGSVGQTPITPLSGDPDLEAISGENINDVAILEFDFIPLGDTLRFNYVFASDEYPEFVNSFNDAFGFFLAGPGIAGPFTAPLGFPDGSANIALVPGTDVPVTINNVNNGNDGINGPCVNCEFYVHNGTGFDEPFASDPFYIQYDGFTTVLEAFALVECGETYHIKLAIGDALDSAYDSAVFLEAGSFEAPPSGFTVDTYFPLGLVEISDRCDSGFATISRPCDTDTAWYMLDFLEGDDSLAVYGVDFEELDTLVILPDGVRDSTFSISTIPDGIEEGTEWLCIEVSESADGVTFTIIDTLCIPIIDQYSYPVSVNDQILYCPEDQVNLQAFPQAPGVAPFEYFWTLNGIDTLSTESNYIAEQPENFGDTVVYTLEVRDFCGAFNDPTNPIAVNRIPQPTQLDLEEVQEYCPGTPYVPSFVRNGGTFPFTYQYQVNDGPVITQSEPDIDLGPDLDAIRQFGDTSAWVKLQITDNCNPARSDIDSVLVIFPEPLFVEVSLNRLICIDQELELMVNAEGGYPPYTFDWVSSPSVVFEIDSMTGEGLASAFLDYNSEDPDAESEYIITLEVNDFCSEISDIVSAAVDIDTTIARDCFIPNVVSANGDDRNDSFIVYELINRPGRLFIYNRWGNLLAETTQSQWTPTGDEPDGTYFYVVQFDDGGEEKGSFTILR